MKKSFSLLLILLFITSLLLLGCESNNDEKMKVVAIATLVSHPALDSIQTNLKEELARSGYIEGKNISYVIKNAGGQLQLAANIANDLASRSADVVVAITTPMAQAVSKQIKGPFVFSAVTDPVGAGLVNSLGKGEELVTGVSDAWPYHSQLKLIREITPTAKKIGVLYNPGEAASQYGIKQIRSLSQPLNFELEEGAVNTSSEVYAVAQNLASQSDVLFLSSDSTVIGGIAAALKVAVENKIPLYVGDSGTVGKGGLATVSVGYDAVGVETGKLVARLLHGERFIPTVVANGTDVFLNTKAAKMMGVEIPEETLRKASKVFTEIKE